MNTTNNPILIESPYATSLKSTVLSHGWFHLAPWCWNSESQSLSRLEQTHSNSRIFITVRQNDSSSFFVSVTGSNITSSEICWVKKTVGRWLSFDWDPINAIAVADIINSDIAASIGNGHGRFLRGSTFYEDFVKTLCTVQIAWSGTIRMAASLIDKGGDGVFPTPQQILNIGEARLRTEIRLGFRAPHLINATQKLLELGLMDDLGLAYEDRITYEILRSLHGIGPYAASHIRMLLHDFSRIPIDSSVSRSFKEHDDPSPTSIQNLFSQWGKYKFLGYKLSL